MKHRYTTVVAKQVLNRVNEPMMPFDWSINPYRGCAHGCSFCYARGFQRFLGLEADDEFQHHIMVKSNAPAALEAQLRANAAKHRFDIDAAARSIGVVAIGTVTDPYQPAEGRTALTREILQTLAKYRIAVSITTRSPLIARDIDLLARMNVQAVNISLGTLDPIKIRKLEPNAPLPAGRLQTLRLLGESGVRAGVFIAPILPFLTDDPAELEALVAACKEHGAAFAMASVLRLSKDVKAWYRGVLGEHYPQLLPAYARLYAAGKYAEREYVEAIRARASRLIDKHGLSAPAWAPAPAAGVSGAGCAEPAFRTDIEQLAFSFE